MQPGDPAGTAPRALPQGRLLPAETGSFSFFVSTPRVGATCCPPETLDRGRGAVPATPQCVSLGY